MVSGGEPAVVVMGCAVPPTVEKNCTEGTTVVLSLLTGLPNPPPPLLLPPPLLAGGADGGPRIMCGGMLEFINGGPP
jgi:hypothetical protein